MHSSDSSLLRHKVRNKLNRVKPKKIFESLCFEKGLFFSIIGFLYHIIRILFLKLVCMYKLSVINLQESIMFLNPKSRIRAIIHWWGEKMFQI